jgi:hypothetical protein
MRKQIQLSKNTLKKLAEYLFLACTAEQAAYIAGISPRTLARIKVSPLWPEIQQLSLALELPFRRKVWQGQPGWQGAAWMLERKYPSQLAKPEIQLAVNTSQTTNNVLVISAERAANLHARANAIEAQVAKLKPNLEPSPSNRHLNVQVSDKLELNPEEPMRLHKANASSKGNEPDSRGDDKPECVSADDGREQIDQAKRQGGSGDYSPSPTPASGRPSREPSLPRKSGGLAFSSNSKSALGRKTELLPSSSNFKEFSPALARKCQDLEFSSNSNESSVPKIRKKRDDLARREEKRRAAIRRATIEKKKARGKV